MELANLVTLTAPELRARWAATFGRPAPRRVGRTVLLRGISWHLQAQVHGSLKRSTQRQLEIQRAVATGKGKTARESRTLRPGTQLLRDWQGETHAVEVAEDGFVWRGERFRSLSVIAARITGTRWSGPRFFGLRTP